MPIKREPTPVERYKMNLEMLYNINRDCLRAGLGACWTEDELEEIAMKIMKSDEDVVHEEKNRVNKYLKENSPEQVKSQMITISIDQNLEPAKALEIQFKVIEKIKSANYKCLQNVSHKFEYWSDAGWNPHIHIVSDKNKSDGQVAQLIRRKLKDMPEAYRIYVNTLTYEIHSQYIKGQKAVIKQVYLIKDDSFREIHQIEDIYNW